MYLTVEECTTIAQEEFNIPITECEFLFKPFDIVRATERIFTWLKFNPNIDCINYIVFDLTVDAVIKRAITMYVLSYHKDDTENSTNDKRYELVAYNYLKNNNLLSYRCP